MYKVLAVFCYVISGFLFLFGLFFLLVSIPISLFFLFFGVLFVFLGVYSWRYQVAPNNTGSPVTYSKTTDTITIPNSIPASVSIPSEELLETDMVMLKNSTPDKTNVTISEADTSANNFTISRVNKEAFKPFPDFVDALKKKYEYSNVNFFTPADCIFTGTKINTYVSFMKEPSNEYDSNAVAIYIDDKKIGYVYRGKIQDMLNDWIDRDDIMLGKFDTSNTICIAFYRSLDALSREYDSYSFSLTSFSKKDAFDTKRSENLYLCSEGDSVELEYDYTLEKFIASVNGLEIGELSVSNSEKIDGLISENDYICVIKSLETFEKTSCKIKLFIKK